MLLAAWDPIRVKIGGLDRSIFKDEYVFIERNQWVCYPIREIELFSGKLNSGGEYSWDLGAMDMWTLGCLLYDMLFSSPPPGCCCGVRYCTCKKASIRRKVGWSFDDCGLGSVDFPVDLLRNSSVAEIKKNHMEILEFMKSLLALTPDARITVEEALESPWVFEFKQSQYFSDYELPTTFERNNIVHSRTEWGPGSKWTREAKIGCGGYGTVWLQRSHGGSYERAVKAIQNKGVDSLREIEILSMVTGVSILSLNPTLWAVQKELKQEATAKSTTLFCRVSGMV